MLSDRLKNEISDLILSGEFPPGARLDEQTLAQRFGVSRTPVRECILQLAAAGLVETRPRRSALVRAQSRQELAESLEAMGETEALCARYSAERMTEAERVQLRTLIAEADAASEAQDRVRCRELDAAFHHQLHQGAHNGCLARVAADLRLRTGPYSAAPYTMAQHGAALALPHQQHRQIMEAVVARDAATAHRLMIEHISTSLLTIQSILSADGTLSPPSDRPATARRASDTR